MKKICMFFIVLLISLNTAMAQTNFSFMGISFSEKLSKFEKEFRKKGFYEDPSYYSVMPNIRMYNGPYINAICNAGIYFTPATKEVFMVRLMKHFTSATDSRNWLDNVRSKLEGKYEKIESQGYEKVSYLQKETSGVIETRYIVSENGYDVLVDYKDFFNLLRSEEQMKDTY